jgi:hypothetical protein
LSKINAAFRKITQSGKNANALVRHLWHQVTGERLIA